MARAAAVISKSTTRQKLLAAAHDLIWANSYAQVSVEDICRRAGVQKGSFYHFFPTKNDLAAAALEDHWHLIKPELDAIFAENATPHAQLKALCASILDKQKEAQAATGTVCGCPYGTLAAELAGSHESLRDISTQMNARFLGYFEQLMKNAAAAGLVPTSSIAPRAQEMQVYVIGAMFHARITHSLTSLGQPLEAALMRLSGIGK